MIEENKTKKTTKEKLIAKKEKIKVQKKKAKKKVGGVWQEFKKFVSRGNVVDMSIGVVIGTAFGAIVTALTNIFLSVCTWGVPGGLNGLITVLPAVSAQQAGMGGIQSFASSDIANVLHKLGDISREELLANYTLYGSTYVYNGAAIINWGNFINAALSFIVIAIVLFTIVKVFASLHHARIVAQEKALEEYYKKHPEDRPAPAIPNMPEPTDHMLLKEILNQLKIQNGTANKPQEKGTNTNKK